MSGGRITVWARKIKAQDKGSRILPRLSGVANFYFPLISAHSSRGRRRWGRGCEVLRRQERRARSPWQPHHEWPGVAKLLNRLQLVAFPIAYTRQAPRGSCLRGSDGLPSRKRRMQSMYGLGRRWRNGQLSLVWGLGGIHRATPAARLYNNVPGNCIQMRARYTQEYVPHRRRIKARRLAYGRPMARIAETWGRLGLSSRCPPAPHLSQGRWVDRRATSHPRCQPAPPHLSQVRWLE